VIAATVVSGSPGVAENGADVIVIGDAEILDDQFLGGGWPENELFADNLISFGTHGSGCP
jgi:hypothetical protein